MHIRNWAKEKRNENGFVTSARKMIESREKKKGKREEKNMEKNKKYAHEFILLAISAQGLRAETILRAQQV